MVEDILRLVPESTSRTETMRRNPVRMVRRTRGRGIDIRRELARASSIKECSDGAHLARWSETEEFAEAVIEEVIEAAPALSGWRRPMRPVPVPGFS